MVNLAYQASDSLMTYATWSRGFKSGGFSQRVFPPIIPGGASSNVVQKYDAPLGRGLAIIPAFNLTTAAGTNNVIFTLQVSANGTSWTTSSGLTHTVAGNGTETVRSLWYIPTTSLDGVAYWRLATVNNAANTPPISNLTAVATWRNP
jgi:outer membrane receptor protein involved in Fe transport